MTEEINFTVYIVVLIINGVNFLPIFDVIFKFTNCSSSRKAKLELSCCLALAVIANTIAYLFTNTKITLHLQIRSFLGTFSELSIFFWITSISHNTEAYLSFKHRFIYVIINIFCPFLFTTIISLCNAFANSHPLIFTSNPYLHMTIRLIELISSFTNAYLIIKHTSTKQEAASSYTTPIIQLVLLSLSIICYYLHSHSVTIILMSLFNSYILISTYIHNKQL